MKALQHILSRLLRTRKPQAQHPRRSTLRIEALEDRFLPSTSGLNVIVDNTSASFSTSGTGWTLATGGYLNHVLTQSTNADSTATWQLNNLNSGYYDVQLTWTPGTNRSNAATYQIYDGGTLLKTVTFDQTMAPLGGTTVSGRPFQDLGLFLDESNSLSVVLEGSNTGVVVADAVHVLSSTGIHGLPTATFSGPATVKEGITTAKVAFTTPTGGSLGYTYSYDLNNDGTFEISGSSSSSVTIPESFLDDGPSTLVVHGRITDSVGQFTDYTTSIAVTNVAPTAKIYLPPGVDLNVPATFKAVVSDPSKTDTTAGFTYAWDFGDSTTSSVANPSHTYTALGTYHVTLTVTDKDGGVGSAAVSIIVAPVPTATFSGPAAVNEGTTTAKVTFTNQAHGSHGYTYSYDFNDNGTFESIHNNSSSVAIPESFLDDGAAGGVTTVTVLGRITDSVGGYSDYTTTITVNNVAPTPKITLPSGIDVNVAAVLKASATDPSKADTTAGFTYAWNFGDGTTGTGASPSHTYTALGTYTVTLTATDKDGGVGTTSLSLVAVTAPTAIFSGPAAVNEGTTTARVTFASPAHGTGGYKYSYDFNNDGKFEISGSTSASAIIPESYLDDGAAGGVTLVTVHGRISDGLGGYTDYTTLIEVDNVAPTPRITAPSVIDVNVPAAFKASATDPSTADTRAGFTYAWDFGDSTTGSGASPSHTYTTTGIYTVTLTATDKDGGVGTTTTTVTVGPSPTATFSGPAAVNEGTTTAQVTFTSPANGSGGYKYSYDFNNDGRFEISNSSSTTVTIPESYLDDGAANGVTIVTVHGRVTDSLGGYSDYTTLIEVDNVAPTPTITAPSAIDVNVPAAFKASAFDPSTADTRAGFNYVWDFGDSNAGYGATPSHTYTTAGTYLVTLTATDKNGGVGTTTMFVTVALSPTATFSGPSTVTEGTSNALVTFSSPANGSGGYKYSYDFNNDGKFEVTNSSSPIVIIPESYLDNGPATVVIHGRITDSIGGYTDYTTTITVTNVPPTITSVTLPSSLVAGTAGMFSASATDPSTADTNVGFTYMWNFGDGSTGYGSTTNHTYTSAGPYTVTLTVIDQDGGMATDTESLTVATSLGG